MSEVLVTYVARGIERVRKIDATHLGMRKTGFTPEGNFSVLILRRMSQQEVGCYSTS